MLVLFCFNFTFFINNQNSYTFSDIVGGILGTSSYVTISNTYSASTLNDNLLGGMVGYALESVNINNGFYNNKYSCIGSGEYVLKNLNALELSEMKSSTFLKYLASEWEYSSFINNGFLYLSEFVW